MSNISTADITDFFNPRGIALVGATAKPGKPNNQILRYAMQMGFDGTIYPINPTKDEIEGLKCYPDLLAIPGPVDLIIVSVNPSHCIKIANDIKTRRESKGDAGAVIVVAAGFKEMGTEEGIRIQKEMIDLITGCGARLIGPNCQGVVDAYHGVNSTFSVPPDTPKGGLSIFSQSGAFATSFLRWAKDLKMVGLNKFVSLGNMADVNFTELLKFAAEDEKTKVISLYMDGINDARSMIDIASKVTKKKPVVVIKAGKTNMGTNVAYSHTASIAGNNSIYDGAFKQAGVIRARSVADFYHTSRCFDKLPLPKGNRVCIMTVVGGPSTICVDELVLSGEVQLAHFTDELKVNLSKYLAPSANIGHPDGYIDMTASVTEKMHSDVLKLLMADDNIDGIIFMTTPPGFIKDEGLAQAIIEVYNSVPADKRKPLLSVLLAGSAVSTCRRILEENGLPTFEYPDDAAHVMVNMVRYHNYLNQAE